MLDKKDYMEPMCPFDRDFHKDKKESKPLKRINVGEMISQIDRLYARNDGEAVARVLEEYAAEARRYGDTDGELAAINELLGNYRMAGKKEKGLETADRCFELLKKSQNGGSVSTGTILINAGTALSSFGDTDRAEKCYTDACRCYSNSLPPEDLRFAALYNNMASVYEQKENFSKAEGYYKLALSVLEKNSSDARNLLDAAVTHINLAQLYCTLNCEDERAGEYAEKAMAIFDSDALPRDYYYAHTAGKCAGAFGYLGYFMYEIQLKERAKEIYERT